MKIIIDKCKKNYMSYNIKNIRKQFKDKGIFYTPDNMAKLIKDFANKENPKNVYDPTCGDGSLLSVFEDSIPKYGQEINEDQLEVAKNRLINFNGVCGDTLKEPAFLDKKFDLIVANYPFSIQWEPKNDERFECAPCLAPKSKADYAFILHILYMLGENGTAAVLGFPGILYRGNAEGKIRQYLVETGFIKHIVMFPPNQFVDTKISTVLIIFEKSQHKKIIFEDYEHSLKREVDYEEIKENDFNLSVNTYVRYEEPKEEVNPIELDKKARKDFLQKIKQQIIIQNEICRIDNTLEPVEKFIDEIEQEIKRVKEQIKC